MEDKLNINRPLVSVITVVCNGEKHIEGTIRSVIHQTYDDFEYVIVDGGSTDQTMGIVRKYEDRIDRWISEKDEGIYDAMNKGVRLSKGKWIYFLGSDDFFRDEKVLERVKGYLKDNLAVVFGRIEYEDGKKVVSRFNWNTWLHNTIHHQSAFYNRSLFDNWEYDTRLKIISDYELNLMIFLKKNGYRFVDEVIAVCGSTGLSRTKSFEAFKETNRVRRKHLGILRNCIFYGLFSAKHLIYMIFCFIKKKL